MGIELDLSLYERGRLMGRLDALGLGSVGVPGFRSKYI